MAWVLANEAIRAPIIGAIRLEQFGPSLAVAGVTIEADLKRMLNEATHGYGMDEAHR